MRSAKKLAATGILLAGLASTTVVLAVQHDTRTGQSAQMTQTMQNIGDSRINTGKSDHGEMMNMNNMMHQDNMMSQMNQMMAKCHQMMHRIQKGQAYRQQS